MGQFLWTELWKALVLLGHHIASSSSVNKCRINAGLTGPEDEAAQTLSDLRNSQVPEAPLQVQLWASRKKM